MGFSFGGRPTRTRSLQDGWFGACGPDGWLHESCMGWMEGSAPQLATVGGLLRRHAPHPALLAIKPVLLTSHVKSQCLNWSAVPVCRKLPESRRLRCGIEHMAMNAQPELATQNCTEPARAAHIAWMG